MGYAIAEPGPNRLLQAVSRREYSARNAARGQRRQGGTMLTGIHRPIDEIEETERKVMLRLGSSRGTPLPGLAVFDCKVKSRRGK